MGKNAELSAEQRAARLEAQMSQLLGGGVEGERIEEIPGEMHTVNQRLGVLEARMRAGGGRLSLLEERVDVLETMEEVERGAG